jgi:glycosyltransferase involved in cell wall biosynthesis
LSLFKLQNVEQAIPFSCVFLANYEPRKGHKFLFEALEKVRQTIPQLTLFIYGGHEEEQMNFVKSLHSRYAPNLDVRFNGYNSSISKQLRKFKVLLICSQKFESFGLTAIEAMIQGVPVVSTNVGGLKEVIKVDGNGGFLFNKDDVEGFSKKVIELMEDEELGLDIGRRGIDYVNDNFGIEKMVFDYKKFLI